VTLERALLRVGGTVVGPSSPPSSLPTCARRRRSSPPCSSWRSSLLALALNYGLGVIFLTRPSSCSSTPQPPATGCWLAPHREHASRRRLGPRRGHAPVAAGGAPRRRGRGGPSGPCERELLDGVLHSLTQRPAERDGRELTLRHQQAGRAVDNAQAAFQRLLAQRRGCGGRWRRCGRSPTAHGTSSWPPVHCGATSGT